MKLLSLWTVITLMEFVISDSRVDALASLMREITGQLEKFNGLYMNQLDRELSSTSSKLAAIDSTLRSVADRAVAWDNIQNHMTVWTDQTRTMEKKLDLLNRHHEKQALWEGKLSAIEALNHKLVNLDKKINTMTRLEFKVEKISERLEEMNSKLNNLRDKVSVSSILDQQGFGHLAKIGLSNYMDTIENKLDNITKTINKNTFQYSPKNSNPSAKSNAQNPKINHLVAKHTFQGSPINSYAPKQSVFNNKMNPTRLNNYEPKTYEVRNKGSWTVMRSDIYKRNQLREKEKCSSSATTYDPKILEDVRAKVDILFDRITNPDYEYDYDNFAENFKREAIPISEEGDSEKPFEKSLTKFWTSLFSPIKKLNRKLKNLEKQLQETHPAPCVKCSSTTAEESLRNTVHVLLEANQKNLNDTLKRHFSMLHESSSDQISLSKAILEKCTMQENDTQILKHLIQDHNKMVEFRIDQMAIKLENYCRSDSLLPSTPAVNTKVSKDFGYKNQSPTLESLDPVPTVPAFVSPSVEPKLTFDCSDLYMKGYRNNQVYLLGDPNNETITENGYYYRFCDQTTSGGGWTVIQRRGNFAEAPINFTRSWDEYKKGFGLLEREFWWGNDFIHMLTNEENMTVRFDLWDFEGNQAFAEYSEFRVSSENDNYRLNVIGYFGNASDSFSTHNDFLFSTYDVDNDKAPDCCPCAPAYGGGWWFYSCFESNLNGDYHMNPTENDHYRGLIWELWLGDYSLKATEIKIRPNSFKKFAFPTPFPENDLVNSTPELP